jgi:hypothetical protein
MVVGESINLGLNLNFAFSCGIQLSIICYFKRTQFTGGGVLHNDVLRIHKNLRLNKDHFTYIRQLPLLIIF